MTIVVTAVFTALPDRRDRLIAALTAAVDEIHPEPGCEVFALHEAADGTLVYIEKWTDAPTLDAHGAGTAVARLNASIADLIASPPVVTRLSPIPAGTPHQGLL